MSSLPPLRQYQSEALASLQAHWRSGVRRVCIVMPPGGGKTRTGVDIPRLHAEPSESFRVLWLAHRKELIRQAADELRNASYDVGCVSPDFPADPWATVQVASVDTLTARTKRPPAELVILDECHHYVADTYRTVAESYLNALHVGLTATPQRQDGRPLGDMFEELIVGATYSQLLAEGSLVPCRVFRPDEYLGGDLAREPLDAWLRVTRAQKPNGIYAGPQTFAFARDVKCCHEHTALFNSHSVPSIAIDATTPKRERDYALECFREGSIRVLWNVYVFSEGTNVPEAECCLLARGVGHPGPYLQITGRVLRPAPYKTHATLIDLAGVSHLHGLPTQDREYALDGRAIRAVGESLKNCPKCGTVLPAAASECDGTMPDGSPCGYLFQQKPRKAPKIFDLELREAVAAAGGDPSKVDDERKLREWRRLRSVCDARGFGLYWAMKQYRAQGLGEPPMGDVTDREKVRELSKLIAMARTRGFKPGFAKIRFKEMFQEWPRADMLAAAEVWHG